MSNVIHADFGSDLVTIGIKCEVLYSDAAVVLIRNTIRMGESETITHHAEEL